MDIEKTFDSSDHNLLISTLKKYDFSKNFVSWVKILSQQSCVLNGGATTKYFMLERGT